MKYSRDLRSVPFIERTSKRCRAQRHWLLDLRENRCMHPQVTHGLADTSQRVAPSWLAFLEATHQHRRTCGRTTLAAVCVVAIAGGALLAFGQPLWAAAVALVILAFHGAHVRARRPTADAIQLFHELAGVDPDANVCDTSRTSAVIILGPWPARPSEPAST